jgi:hypothetical protein
MAALLVLGLLAVPAEAQILPSFGRDRAGTSGFQFLKIPVDARSAALGETTVATAFDASALFWNPALAAHARTWQLATSHTQYFAGVTMNYGAFVFPLRRLTLGTSIQVLSAGEMDVTTEFQPTGTGETFGFNSVAFGVTAAQALSDIFSYGITAKWVHEATAGLTTQTALIDLGIFYRVGDTGAQMAVSIRNFGVDGTPSGELERIVIGQGTLVENEFTSVTPPTTFLLGFAYDVFHRHPTNSLNVSAQISNPNDNAEALGIGAEFLWNDLLALRAGYRFGIEESSLPSLGIGLHVPGLQRLRFDYGFNQLERLGNVHRIGLNYGL